ncbi:MAG: endonuclease/exonuclease/phosphatase family protein [Roseitalea sp.]|jgi:endonuclease/exonuclease/phosphatase family metal-dependent hydrolase|nr:endonuclease/exonuclease/phosphatase family protein [Roseitalea sp.]MBO6723242.1 endonuclease/exonuclease/phosphatase family protein [Roseitalea sp.]MBO6744416.1 endonuclease/exonuclease/phosphatase family protein [Roseitalea sp.]
MKIAAFNVENLFDRARAFNISDNSQTSDILSAVSELNSLFEKPIYSAADKARMIALLIQLDLERSDRGDFVLLRQIRERVVRRPRNGDPIEIIQDGRGDWVGWAELRTEAVNAVAIMNTGRVMRDVDADILAVIEAEDRVALKMFSEMIIAEVGGTPYEQVMVIDGNDQRGIDVGLMCKRGHSIGLMQSHIHDFKPNGQPVFSRDCPEYAVTTPAGETIWVLPNHFKSKFGGNDQASRDKREAQARRVADIYNRLKSDGHDKVVVLGDLNDTPDSDELAPLLGETDLKEISDHPSFDTGEFTGRPGERGIGTYALGNDRDKIDYLLLSPVLFDRVTTSGLFRKGAWPGSRPPRWTVYPELTRKVHVASDHHVIWAEIADPGM